jgi:hypothetical protein
MSFELTPHATNTLSAELTRDFYVASKNTHSQAAYLPMIGKRAALLTEDELQ